MARKQTKGVSSPKAARRKMRKKKGADISAEDERKIKEFVIRYYFTEPD